jgi:6-phosphofructo-2-kinase
MERRRKTLPVVKSDHDIEHHEESYYTSDHVEHDEPTEFYSHQQDNHHHEQEKQHQSHQQPSPFVPGHWVKLSEDDDTPHLFRHSVGLEEIPGVVTTLKPASKYIHILNTLYTALILLVSFNR